MAQMRSILESSFGRGAWNMAVDSAIAEAVAAGHQPPTLRLYGWQPFCLSLGYGQRLREADQGTLMDRGWDLVRRPTGGKAILHGDELTYSLCLPLDHPLASGDIVESYRRISVGFLRALETLGLEAVSQHKGAEAGQGEAGPVCFELSSHYEITVAGRKLIGSAQLRRKGVVLQHGTLPLNGDAARICDVLAFGSDDERAAQKRRVRERATSLAASMGFDISWQEAAAALEQGFRRAFGDSLFRGRLSDCESARAEALRVERFGNPDWTKKR